MPCPRNSCLRYEQDFSFVLCCLALLYQSRRSRLRIDCVCQWLWYVIVIVIIIYIIIIFCPTTRQVVAAAGLVA